MNPTRMKLTIDLDSAESDASYLEKECSLPRCASTIRHLIAEVKRISGPPAIDAIEHLIRDKDPMDYCDLPVASVQLLIDEVHRLRRYNAPW